jgi:hypothetical protein
MEHAKIAPEYLKTTIKLPKLVLPTIRSVTLLTKENHYDAFKLSIIERCNETISVLQSAILERSEWIRSNATIDTNPIFTIKFTAVTLSHVRAYPKNIVDMEGKIDELLQKKSLSPKGKFLIIEAKKCCDMKIDEEVAEFLDTLQMDLETRFKDASEQTMENINKDKEREINSITLRNFKDLKLEVKHIYTSECVTTPKPHVKATRTVSDKLRISQNEDRELYYKLLDSIREEHGTSLINFEIDMAHKPNLDDLRKSYITELEMTKQRRIKMFSLECARRSRSYRAEMVNDVDETKVNLMIDVYISKMHSTASAEATTCTRALLTWDKALSDIDMSYEAILSDDNHWDIFSTLLSDYWYYLGNPTSRHKEYLDIVRMYAILSSSDFRDASSMNMTIEIDNLKDKIHTLLAEVKLLDKEVTIKCKSLNQRYKKHKTTQNRIEAYNKTIYMGTTTIFRGQFQDEVNAMNNSHGKRSSGISTGNTGSRASDTTKVTRQPKRY